MYLKGKIMNTLELNAMGLAPMTEVEMQEVDGGGILLTLLFFAVTGIIFGLIGYGAARYNSGC